MKYALVLENSTEACNATSTLLASLGYLITPVFSPKKALHAAHMIQFDLIAISTTSIPGDRRCLAGELARCSPDATIILLADPEPGHVNGRTGGIRAVLRRPLAPHELQAVIEGGRDGIALQPPPCPERRGAISRTTEKSCRLTTRLIEGSPMLRTHNSEARYAHSLAGRG